MLRNALGTHVARGAAIAANALVFASAIVPLAAQQAPPDARATSAPGSFSLEQMLSYPYIDGVVHIAHATAARVGDGARRRAQRVGGRRPRLRGLINSPSIAPTTARS